MWNHVLTELNSDGIHFLRSSQNHNEIQVTSDNQHQSIGEDDESPTILVDELVNTRGGEGTKKIYSREVMEALRFVNAKEKRKLWKSVLIFTCTCLMLNLFIIYLFCGLFPNLDNIPEAHSKDKGNGLLSLESIGSDAACSSVVGDEDNHPIVEGDYSEDDDSDEDYASIQRPAFAVQGEPNFDSGPPEDGLEYLRRVRGCDIYAGFLKEVFPICV
ncbi:hypothetical protein CsatB_030238 [Cannabis sativa]